MLALRKIAPQPGVLLTQAEPPGPPSTGEVQISVAAAGLCGSDLHIVHWSSAYHHLEPCLPLTLGHEFSGRISAAGPAVDLLPGTRVTVRPAVSCGTCDACRGGDRDACRSRKGIGVMRDGAFAPMVNVPAANCLVLPDALDDRVAALAEPLAIGANALATARLTPGMRVLIFGPGTIGQGIALLSRRAGAAEIAIAGYDDGPRLRLLHELGFTQCFDLAADGAASRLGALAGDGFDVVFEASGAGPVVQQALDLLRPAGVLVVVGIHGRPASFDVTRLVRRRLQIRGAFSAPAGVWPGVLTALSEQPETFARLISHVMPLGEAEAAIALAERRDASKIILLPT